jgi:hypothetical protein
MASKIFTRITLLDQSASSTAKLIIFYTLGYSRSICYYYNYHSLINIPDVICNAHNNLQTIFIEVKIIGGIEIVIFKLQITEFQLRDL